MGKQPYIPLYIGDWEQDTNTISLEAEGALLKLIFKLWKAKDKGQYQISLNQLSILLKKGNDLTLKILQELKKNEVLNIEFLPEEEIKIESRRMRRDIEKSRVAKENGSKGGRPKKPKQKQTKSKSKAKPNLNTEYESDNEIENEYENVTVISATDFEIFWEVYDKKIGDKAKLKKKWDSFTEQERETALNKIPAYVKATPDKKYRKNPETFLNNKSWNDEIITPEDRRPIPAGSNKSDVIKLVTETIRNRTSPENGNYGTGH